MVPTMKRALLATLVLLQSTAWAECYVQSTYLNQIKSQIERTADEQRFVGIIDGQKLCRVAFRVMVSGQWHTAQGEALGMPEVDDAQLCARATDTGRARLLESIGSVRSSVTQDMICTDKDIPKWKPVRVGDHIRESEVAPHPNPARRKSFAYMGQECRWFVETVPFGTGGLEQNSGIMCRLKQDDWYIVDKWVNSRG